MLEHSVSRRLVLKAGAAIGGGLMIGWRWECSTKAAADDATLFAPNAFVRIDRQGKVSIVSPMAEMGQGVYTALPMLVAEELDADMSNVTVEHSPPSDKLYGNAFLGGVQTTGNSSSIRAFYVPLRQAGAAARAMLVAAAAEKLNVDASALTTEPGFVVEAAGKRRIAYGELADAAAKMPVPTDVKLKDPSTFRIVGTPAKRLDVAGKVDGTAVFGIDVKLPSMQIATVAASPVFGGTLASLDEAAALKVPGVHQVVKLDNAVAVIADHYWAARKGLDAADPKFDNGPHAALTTADVVAALAKASERQGAVAKNEGDVVSALANAATKVEATYEAPFLAHATMEPMNCTVQVTSDGCDIWVGTQIPTVAQQAVAQTLGLKQEAVRIYNHLLGGGFGRRLEYDFIVQAALIAKQSKEPVKVVWSREEDIQHDMYRPYYYDRISAGLDEQGMPIAWSHRIVGSSIMARFFPPAFKDGIDPDAVDGAVDMPYAIPNKRVEYVREEPPGIPTAFWRGVGPTHNVYVVESFIDELAAAAKKDPVDYRRAMLGNNPRALHVLNRAAEMSGWGTPLADSAAAACACTIRSGAIWPRSPRSRSQSPAKCTSTASCAPSIPASPSIPIPSWRRCRAASFSASRRRCGARSRSRTAASSRRTSTTTECCASTRRRRSRSRSSRAARTRAASASPARRRWCRPCSMRSMRRPACGCASCRSTRGC